VTVPELSPSRPARKKPQKRFHLGLTRVIVRIKLDGMILRTVALRTVTPSTDVFPKYGLPAVTQIE
jgi:hypothetical protein